MMANLLAETSSLILTEYKLCWVIATFVIDSATGMFHLQVIIVRLAPDGDVREIEV
jgi:hypothetical protein